MNAMVVVMFSAYSKQSHEGRRGGRSLIGRSKEAGGRHMHRHSRRMDAQGSAIGRPVKKCVLLSTLCINLSDYPASFLPLLCLPWPIYSVHWAITVACTTCCATTAVWVAQWTHNGRTAAVTQKQNVLGLGDPWASWSIFWLLNGGTKVAALCKGGFR